MARYAAVDVGTFLAEGGFGPVDRYATGTVRADDGGLMFILPDPVEGWCDADIIDRIFADRWVWTGPGALLRRDGDVEGRGT